jgi:hypothetical protein
MKKYAIIENDIVVNLIECNFDFIQTNNLDAIPETKETGIAYVGANFIEGKFVLPNEIIEANKGGFDLEIRQQIDAEIVAKQNERQAIADRLGLTADELKVLLG